MERSKITKRPNLTGLGTYSKQGGRMCGVCSSPHRKFIEQALSAGHSKRAVREYLAAEFGVQLPNLGYHLQNHYVKKATKS